MKALIFVLSMLISVGAFAQVSSENLDYRKQAIAAATVMNNFNWGSAGDETFEIIKEDYVDSELNSSGTYTVRLYLLDKKTKEKSDGGKDFEVYIYGGAVLSVKINCRLCG
jgi:hypothetical protein